MRQNYVFSLYCSPDLDDRIFDSLLASIAAVQAEDVHASFLFVCDLNGHHLEWLSKLQPSTSQLSPVVISWLSAQRGARGGTLVLLMTDVTDLVWVAVVLRSLPSVGSHFDLSSSSKLVCEYESFPETSSQLEHYLWCNTGSALA